MSVEGQVFIPFDIFDPDSPPPVGRLGCGSEGLPAQGEGKGSPYDSYNLLNLRV